MSDRISINNLANLLRQAGFPEKDIPTMIGIAGGESSFNPRAFNPDASTGDQSYGLFQINMLGDLGPERRAQFGLKSNEELYDPVTNIRAAKKIYDTQGLGAWGAYTNQSYKNSMPDVRDLTPASNMNMEGMTNASYNPQDMLRTMVEGVYGGGSNPINIYSMNFTEQMKEDPEGLVRDQILSRLFGQALNRRMQEQQELYKPKKSPIRNFIDNMLKDGGGYLDPTKYFTGGM